MIERQNAAGFEALDRNVAADLALRSEVPTAPPTETSCSAPDQARQLREGNRNRRITCGTRRPREFYATSLRQGYDRDRL